jgi:glutathione S-transferase
MLDTDLSVSLDAAGACTAPVTIYAGKSRFPQLRGILRDIRPIWLMEELGEPYQIRWIEFAKDDHKSEAYRLINPFARVPGLWVGELTLFESAAMCVFLADRYGRLAPKPAARERAVMDQWLYCAMSTFEPHTGAVFTCDFMRDKNEATAVARQRAVDALNGDLLPGLDEVLAGRDVLLESGFSVADILMSCVLRFAHHSEVYAPYVNVRRYLERNFARPAFERAFAISNGG